VIFAVPVKYSYAPQQNSKENGDKSSNPIKCINFLFAIKYKRHMEYNIKNTSSTNKLANEKRNPAKNR
jgi:hypothetical protein